MAAGFALGINLVSFGLVYLIPIAEVFKAALSPLVTEVIRVVVV